MKRLLCRLLGHRPTRFAARKGGKHVAGDICVRCHRIVAVRAGSRQERRRVARALAR